MGKHASIWRGIYILSFISFDKISARNFHLKKHFVDGIHAEKDDGEIGFFWDMYPNSLELKVEHQIDHVTFLNLDKNIKEGTFIYKLKGWKVFISGFHYENASYRNQYYHKIFFLAARCMLMSMVWKIIPRVVFYEKLY